MSIDAEKGYNSYLPLRDTFRKQNVSQAMALAQADTLWPREGIVEFHNVHVRYRPNLPPVLKNLDFSVKPCEKIGIVGRTGAGKSTITLCLLRVLELLEGNIIIDGLDIARMSLGELRSKITIILQDPSLYEGTLRENVDPLLEHKDEEILDTLLKCNLKQLLDSRKGLDTEISDSGENLSVGEK
jgi:ABC-type multidrug transport system fused ATPase/permease subunit